jgi:hypothetical protein
MPVLTLAQIISRATELAGGRLDWNASDASFYVNQAAGYVGRSVGIEHRSLESSYATTVTSGVSRMVLPSDYNYAIVLSIGSSVPSGSTRWRILGKRDIGWADTFAGRLDSTTGQPEAYVEYGTNFEVVPSPNSSYSLVLRYRRQTEELTSSGSTYGFDQQWHWSVVLKAAELLAMSRGDTETEQLSRNRYIDYMNAVLPDQAKKVMDQRGSLQPFPRNPAPGGNGSAAL